MRPWLAAGLLLAGVSGARAADEPRGQLVNYVAASIPNRNLNTGAFVEAAYLYRLSRYWHMGGSAGVQYSTTKVNDLSKGRVVLVPVLAKVRAQIPGRYSAYAEAGLGVALASQRLSVDVGRFCADRGLRCEESLDNAVAGSLGGGVTGRVGDTMAVGVNISYLFVEPRATASSFQISNGTETVVKKFVNLSSLQIGANFTIRF